MSLIWDSRGDDDWDLRPIEPEDMCDYCQALDTEPHKDDCPLFIPTCACGTSARRYLNGKPVCKHCQREHQAMKIAEMGEKSRKGAA